MIFLSLFDKVLVKVLKLELHFDIGQNLEKDAGLEYLGTKEMKEEFVSPPTFKLFFFQFNMQKR